VISKLFNWLLKRIPFAQATALICSIWGFLSAIFCFFLIIFKANFAATGTGKTFTITYFSTVLTIIPLVSGTILNRIKSFRILNANIIKGRIRPDISNQELLELYQNFKPATKVALYTSWIYPLIVVVICVVVEWLASGQWINIPVIIASGIIGTLFVLLSVVNTSILVNYPFIKECKNLLAKRGLKFEDFYLTDLKTRLWLFILFMVLTLAGVLMLIYPFKLNILLPLFFGLVISGISIYLVLDSIYSAFSEIKEAAKEISRGETETFFSGSYDKEIIDLSKSINIAAREIYNTRKELEEAKTVLEIKVRARTKALNELAQSLEEKVKERTKELQNKVEELERFYKLAVGRELKMTELKKEIKKLKEELEKYKAQKI
jgi:methyl-accepting chemotaxis protein